MSQQDNDDTDSGTLYQEERALREERRQTKYGDDGDRENARIDNRLREIKKEWTRRSDR